MKFITELHLFILLYSDGYRGEAPDYVMSRSDSRDNNFSFLDCFCSELRENSKNRKNLTSSSKLLNAKSN